MRKLVIVAFFLLFAKATFGATIIDTTFESDSFGGQSFDVRVYLPTGHDPDGDPYPLYVFLHGCCGLDHISGSTGMIVALNNKIDSGEIEPMVVVWPSAQGADFGNRHLWTNSVRTGNGPYEDLVTEDLLTWINDSAEYNVSQEREKRAVGGFSMGADGAIRMSVRNSEKFVAFVSHGGGPAIKEFRNIFPDVVAEAPETEPPFTFAPSNGFFTEVMFGISTAFSPNNGNGPWFVNIPVLPSGDVDESVFTDQWIASHDPATMIQDSGIYTNPLAMYFEVGIDDSLSVPFNTLFHDELTALGVPHTFNIFEGGHSFPWDRVEVTLDWLNDVMNVPSSVEEGVFQTHEDFVQVHENYPNPVNTIATIPFQLAKSSHVRLDIINVEGRNVATLLNEFRENGKHEVEWNASGLPTGVYFYRLQTDQGVDSRKLTLAR